LFTFAPNAKESWVSWFTQWGDATDAAEGEQAAALAKLEGYAARLALLHHVVSLTAADPERLVIHPITETSLHAGISLVEWFASEAVRVYMILRETPEERECRRLVEWIDARGGAVTVRELHRANQRRWPTSEHAELALDALVQVGLGRWSEPQSGPYGGRPSGYFHLLPTSAVTNP
jgi:hypothetical protein